jgi:hypothetical protein
MELLLRVVDGKGRGGHGEEVEEGDDDAAKREVQQRGLKGVWFLKWM